MMKFVLLLLLVPFWSMAEDAPYTVSFGVILKNELGEPIGFQETTEIRLVTKNRLRYSELL